MAPKRAKSAPVQRPAPDWSWVTLEDIESESELTEEHLRKAVGLETARPCRNKLKVQQPVVIDVDEVVDVDAQDRGSPRKDDFSGNGDAKGKGKKKPQPKGNGEEWGPQCTSVWCQDNLLCLNHLGGKAWNGKSDDLSPYHLHPRKLITLLSDAHNVFMEAAKLGNPPVERKDLGAPVGLRNLGATCYANAFLQIWYYTLPFREGIYACAAAGTHEENSPIFQLALTFAALQTSNIKYYDPTGLVNALRLDTGNQQDASEFSKLFMTHLQAEFGKQADARVKTLISDQFEGDLEYVTRCLECGYRSARIEKFLELEMSLEDECTLADRLDHLLASEELSGANAYHCSCCEGLQTARRKINLTKLPPILHFSLLRFVYDAKLGDRRKSKATVEFPARIDMSQWLNADNAGGRAEPIWYELRGVVEHRGASAHRGHFVCQVYDSERDEWYLCNDETVEPVDSLTNSGTSQVANGKSSNRRGSTTDKNVVHTSANAYMLVYERSPSEGTRSSNPNSAFSHTDMTSAPTGRLEERIVQINNEDDALHSKYETRKKQLEESFTEVKRRKLEVMNVWNVQTSTEGFFMHGPSLKQWVEKGLSSKPKEVIEEAVKHDTAPTEDAEDAQRDATEDNATKTGENGTISSVLQGFGVASSSSQDVESKKVLEGPEKAVALVDVFRDSAVEEEGFLPLVFDFKNRAITCTHGKLDPEETKNIKEGLNMLKELGCIVDEELSIHDICRICVMEEAKRTKHRLDHADIRKNFDRAMKEIVDEGEGYLLPSLWLKAWRKGSMDPSNASGIASDWNKDIACEHGKAKAPRGRKTADCVIIPPEAFGCLASLTDTPKIPHFDLSSDVCSDCLAQEAQLLESLSSQIQQAKVEKERLKEMTQKAFLTTSNEIYDGMPAYLLPHSFVHEWLEWIRDPIDVSRPEFSNRTLLCAHDQLLVDPEWNPDRRAGLFTVVYESLWEKIVSLYDVSEADTILLQREKGRDRRAQLLETSVPICVDCWKHRRSTATLKLNILEVHSVDDIPSYSKAAREEDRNSIAVDVDGKRKSQSQLDVRPAKRQRVTRNKKGRSLDIDFNRDATVLQLKTKLYDQWDVLPIFQHLYHDGEELKENTQSLAVLGILTDDNIYVLSDEIPEETDEAMDDEGEEELVAKACARSLAGFNGTALFGLPANIASNDGTAQGEFPSKIGAIDESTLEVAEDDPVQSCKACTFLNPLTAESCIICGMPFD